MQITPPSSSKEQADDKTCDNQDDQIKLLSQNTDNLNQSLSKLIFTLKIIR